MEKQEKSGKKGIAKVLVGELIYLFLTPQDSVICLLNKSILQDNDENGIKFSEIFEKIEEECFQKKKTPFHFFNNRSRNRGST
jgi:hypothetical protein